MESLDTQTSPTQSRCPKCGGLNPRAAEWCGQCLTRFVAPEPPPRSQPPAGNGNDSTTASVPTAPAQTPARVAAPPVHSSGGGNGTAEGLKNFRVTEAGVSWRCALCETENPLQLSVCGVCGASFADTVKPRTETGIDRDPNMAALVSLFFPGAGHAYLGMWAQAIARAVISALVVLVTILGAMAEGSQSKRLATVFAIISFALWVVSSHDSYREAQNQRYAVLLKDKWFLYVVLGILLLLTGMVVMALLGARG